MDNQQRRLQQELCLHGIDTKIVLHKQYLNTEELVTTFLQDIHLVSKEELLLKYSIPNFPVLNRILCKIYRIYETLPLPANFVYAKLYSSMDYLIDLNANIVVFKTRELRLPYSDEYGYLRVNVRHLKPHTNNISIYERLHRIYAMTFLPLNDQSLYPLLEVNHKDGNKHNNSVNNLEWSTKLENLDHAWKTGLRKLFGK